MTEPTNQGTAKYVWKGSGFVYHITGFFFMTLLLTNFQLTFGFIYFEFYTLQKIDKKPYTREMTQTDSMCQEKKEEEDSTALRIAKLQLVKDSKNT